METADCPPCIAEISHGYGVPVGALIVIQSRIDACVKVLRRAKWLKRGVNVTPFVGDLPLGDTLEPHRAIHLSQEGAKSLASAMLQPIDQRGRVLPTLLIELLNEGSAVWVSGLRVQSPSYDGAASKAKPIMEVDLHSPAGSAFTYIELFAGIGGFRVALDKLGGRCVFSSEFCHEARSVYAANFGDIPHGDIIEVETDAIPPHDILTAGFPCQPFSKFGEQEGFDDSRGLLFLEIVRVLHGCRPRAFILENVQNLLYIDDGKSFKEIIGALVNVGYEVDWRLINCGVVLPQERVRVYIVGVRLDVHEKGFEWPELPIFDRSISEILEGSEADNDPEYWLSDHQYDKLMRPKEHRQVPPLRLARLQGTARTLTSSYRQGGARSEYVLHPGLSRPRFYTLRECARLQGFPEDFAIEGKEFLAHPHRAYHQLGNAVCPVIIAAIAAAVLAAIGRSPAGSQGRQLVAPALDLLLAATPPATETKREHSLQGLCDMFLSYDPSGPATCTGTGATLSPADIVLLHKQLEFGRPCVARVALFTIGRVVYLEAQDKCPGRCSAVIVAEELLPLVVACLDSTTFEARRTALLALQNLSRTASAAHAMRGCARTVSRIEALAAGVIEDKVGVRMAREVMCNLKDDL